MATTLPVLTRTIDNAFTQTWYDIKPDAMDNILAGTPIWNILKKRGCFKSQRGGTNIEETIHYAIPTPQAITKGSVITPGEIASRTAAYWTWRYFAANIQRSMIDDQQNSGEFRISSYIENRMTEARDSLSQNYESTLLQAEVTDESGILPQGLNDMVPSQANLAVGTYGGIARSNPWWQAKYLQWTLPYEVNLVNDMKKLYNTIWANLERPNLIISDETSYEIYEEFLLDAVQIVKNDEMDGDLGFDMTYFKGMPMVWSPNMPANGMLMLNTNYIKVMYDPQMWFDMTPWKDTPQQLERAAQIVCTQTVISNQLRRHGRLYANTTDG